MGALKAQVEVMKVRSPRGVSVGQETQNVLQIAGKAPASEANRGDLAAPERRPSKAAAAPIKVSPRPAAANRVESRAAVPAPVSKPVAVKSSSKAKNAKQKPIPILKEPMDPAVAIAERKKARDQSRNELRDFLKQQRQVAQKAKPKNDGRDRALSNRPEWVGVGASLPGEADETDQSINIKTSEVHDSITDAQGSAFKIHKDENEGAEEVDDDCWEEEEPEPIDDDEEDEEDTRVSDEEDDGWGSDGDNEDDDKSRPGGKIRDEEVMAYVLKEQVTALADTTTSIEEEEQDTALSQMETRRMGDMKSEKRARGGGGDKNQSESAQNESNSGFGSDELLTVAEGPARVEQGHEDLDGDDDDELNFLPDEEEDELTEAAAMEYSKMLENMASLLEEGQRQAGNGDAPVSVETSVESSIEADDEFNEDDDELLHMSAILEIENEDEQSMSVVASNAPTRRQKGAAGRYGGSAETTAESTSDSVKSSNTSETDAKVREMEVISEADKPPTQPLSSRSRRASAEDSTPHMFSSQSVPTNLKLADGVLQGEKPLPVPMPLSNKPDKNIASMTVCGIPMPLSHSDREELNVGSDDSQAARIESIRVFLEKKLGVRRFVKAYRLLKSIQDQQQDDADEDALLGQMEGILGPERLQYLDIMFQLITIEEKFQ
mmetsp:Transcript_2626/g.2779  ORF Transcript_2626/g.2779 Transcript_2626/m.2779 type:complete len:664 (-) Transcript_2626:241-2232(-)